jgi:hypothetical protein
MCRSFLDHFIDQLGRLGRALFVLVFGFALSLSHAQVCPFDDGNSSLAVEGLILTRYALGITGAPLVASTGVNAVDAPTVEAAINCPSCGLNITGNAALTVADATIISRKLAGFSGDALTNGLALGSGTRNTPEAVQSFLLAGCGATGGTVTSITAGAGLTGGTITGSGTIAVNTAVIQNRVSGTCAVGSSIRAIAADGTVTCQTDTTGGSGTVTNVATGLGLSGGPVTLTGTISADTTYLQRRVSASCAVGSSIRAIAADGTVTCQVDTGGGGTVTSVGSGTGLSGGPITAAGTLAIANPYRLPQSCADGQVAKYNTSTQLWDCAADVGGGGTVTNVASGTGLTGGPVTTTGTLAIAPSYRLPQSCANGQYTRYNNGTSAWECVTPAVVTNLATGPGLTGGPISSTGTVGLASTQLLPTTACATNQIIKWNGAAWACATEAAASGGTVTSVATGSGLTGGTITTTGTVSLATTQLLPTTACSTNQIIQWNGTAWVCAPSLQTQLASCAIGQVPQLGNGGIISCGTLPHTFTTADATNDVGTYPSIAVPVDGRPVISYFDTTNGDLKVLKCGNASCSIANQVEIVDSTGIVGQYSSIAVPADGLPVISYYGATNGNLKVAKCTRDDCFGATITTVDSTGDVGQYTSIAVSADGLPVISYYDVTNNDLKVIKCGDANCGSGNTITTLDSTGGVGQFTTIAVPADGLPMIAFYDATNTNLKVAKCGNASCSSGNTVSTVDSTGITGFYASIAVPADGRPVISYYDVSTSALKVTRCGNASCSSGNSASTIDSVGVVGEFTSIAVSADGLPVISYYDSTNSKLKLAKCGNANCNSGNTLTVIDSVGSTFAYTAIAVPADARPVISYYDATNGDLKVVKCSNSSCLNP